MKFYVLRFSNLYRQDFGISSELMSVPSEAVAEDIEINRNVSEIV